jgi:hypothetical protein
MQWKPRSGYPTGIVSSNGCRGIWVLQICLTHNYGFAGLHINTGAGFADKNNIETLAPLVEKQIR